MTKGSSTWWFGGTIYPATFGANFHQTVPCAWADPLFPGYVDAEIARVRAAGMNIVRATDWLDRLPTVYGIGLTGPIPEQLWRNLDYLFDVAGEHGIDVCLDLSAFRNTVDGHQDLQSLNGYDASRWRDFLPLVVNRYGGRHNLAYWSIGGEPRPPKEGGVSTAALTKFYADVSGMIRALAPRTLISCGGLSHIDYDAGIDWHAIFGLPNIDLVGLHRYSMGDETVALPAVAAWAKANGKPWLLEEFGWKQSDGDAVRAQEFTRVCNLAIAQGARAVMLWNVGNELKAGSYDVSELTPLTWTALQAAGRTAR